MVTYLFNIFILSSVIVTYLFNKALVLGEREKDGRYSMSTVEI